MSDILVEKKPTTLVKKLVEIMNEIDYVEKRGENTFHHYAYQKAADLTREVRGKLAARNIFMLPSVQSLERFEMTSEKGGLSTAILLMVRYTFLDGDTGETLSFDTPGCGSDKGDKGVYKALTGSLKYAIRDAFLIPDESDPENDEGKYDRGLNDLILAFRDLKVTTAMIEKRLGHSLADITDAERERFREIYAAITKGKEPVSDWFEVPATPKPASAPPVDHTPAPAGDEPRPGEAKRKPGRPAKKKDSPERPPDPKPEPAPPQETHEDPIPTRETPPEPGEQLSVDDRLATENEKAAYIRPKMDTYAKKSSQNELRAFVMDFLDVRDTKDITKSQWDAVIAKLDGALAKGEATFLNTLKERKTK